MKDKNYYEILEISKNASEEIIKTAYKSLVKKYHPDNNRENTDGKSIEIINEAYETLSNPQKRKMYDEELNLLEELRKRKKTSNVDSKKIQIILEKISRMYPNIIDNSDIIYSSRVDIRRSTFFEKFGSYINVPQEAKIFVWYSNKRSGSKNPVDAIMAITDMGIYTYEAKNGEKKQISWDGFQNKVLEISSGLKIGSYKFSCLGENELLMILKEIQEYIKGNRCEENEKESIIKKKISHNKFSIIVYIAILVWCYIKGWNNWFVKIFDALIILWLCDFIVGILKIIKEEDSKIGGLKYFVYVLGAISWYLLTR